MSQDGLFGAPAGWYPDPLGLPQLRWWNNHAWTEQTSAARQPMVVQDTKFAWADDDLPTRRDARVEQSSGESTSSAAATADTLRELEPPRAAAKFEQQPPAEAFVPGTPEFISPTYEAATSSAADDLAKKWWAGVEEDKARAAQAAAAASVPKFTFDSTPEPEAPRQPVAQVPSMSFDTLFDAAPTNNTQMVNDSLDALFGAPLSSKRTSKVRTPIYSPDLAFLNDLNSLGGLGATAEAATAAPSPFQTANPFDTTNPFQTANPFQSATLPQAEPAAAVAEPVSPRRAAAATSKVVSTTGPAWIIAAMPIVQIVASLFAVTALGQNTTPAIIAAIVIVPYLLVVALAYLDYRAMLAAGSPKPLHWAFAFLTAPVYLLLRARATLRESGHGVGPALVWFALALLQIVSVVAVPGIVIATAPTVFAQQIESSVAQQALAFAGSTMTVTCPDTPPVLPGEEITCATVTKAGTPNKVKVTLSRANGWIEWSVVDWGTFVTGK